MRGTYRIAACVLALALGLAAGADARAETGLRKLPWDTEAAEPQAPAPAGPAESEPETPEAATPAASDADASPEPDQEAAASTPPVPPHPTVEIIRKTLTEPKITKGAAEEDVAALQAFYADLSGPPVWITEMGLSAKGQAALFEIGKADDWGLEADAFALPEPDVLPENEEAEALAEITFDLAILKYARFARGGRQVPSEISDLFDQTPPLDDPKTVMAEIAAAEAPGAYLQSLHPQHEQFGRLRTALLEARDADKPKETDIRRLVMNMERWRWMPEELGPLYVWLNTPEFMLYVVKDGKTVFKDKTLVGTIGNPTPVFSADMETIVFNPDWVTPPSILNDKFWPALKRKYYKLLESNKISVSYRGKRIDPTKIDWERVNIHNFTFTQKSGPKNVLGKAKFLYPNKHVVYMHDTLPYRQKVFKEKVRAIGYGCVRMAKPKAFASLLLAEDQELPKSKVKQLWDKSVNKAVTMETKPPVHTTYFTAVVDDKGKVSTFEDLYGLDRKHAEALFGSTDGFPLPPPEPESPTRSVASSATTRDTGFGFANSLGFGD